MFKTVNKTIKLLVGTLGLFAVTAHALDACPGATLGSENYRTFKDKLIKNNAKFEMLNDGLRCKIKTRGFIVDEGAWGCTELANIEVNGKFAPVLSTYEFLDDTQTLATSALAYPMPTKAALDDLKAELKKNYEVLKDEKLRERLKKTPQGMVFVESYQKGDILVTLLRTPEKSKLQVMIIEFVTVQNLEIARENLETCAPPPAAASEPSAKDATASTEPEAKPDSAKTPAKTPAKKK